jgi:hypothetical protein
MKVYGGINIQIHIFLTLVLAAGEWLASRPGHFTHRERAPGAHWIGRLGGPQSWSGRHGEEKILYPAGTNSNPSVIQPITGRYPN